MSDRIERSIFIDAPLDRVWTAIPLFALVSDKSHLYLPLDPTLLGTALALCVPMIASAALPLVRAARAEPARLFAAG